ncbi:MAG: DUF3232 domain-containing protein [Mogibacterium sp.]|nr:DUF3232 domain-containing protein [Mogibacterium sp.]
MKITDYIRQVDWSNEENRQVADRLIRDAEEYLRKVEAHIFKGNEIRAEMFMSFSEKQEEIATLDRRRTAAHNKMLESFAPFLSILEEQTDFDASDHRLDNRTQIADFVAMIAFEMIGREPASRVEGSVRDELAELLHKGEFTFDQLGLHREGQAAI